MLLLAAILPGVPVAENPLEPRSLVAASLGTLCHVGPITAPFGSVVPGSSSAPAGPPGVALQVAA